MRALIWSQYFWPENFRINELATDLRQDGMQITVLTGKPNYPEGKVFPGYRAGGIFREGYEGVEVVRIPLVPRGKGSATRLALNYLSFIFSGCVLAPFALRGKECDVVFVYAPSPLLQALPAIFLARLKHAPLVIWVQDLWPDSLAATRFVKNRCLLKSLEFLVRYIYRQADSVLIQSEAFREPVTRLAADPRKIRYYPNTAEPIPCGAINGRGCEVATEIGKEFSIVFAGNIGVAQSVETILDAAEHLQFHQDIRFFIVGSGSRDAWFAQEVRRRKLNNIVLTGRLPHADMPAVFAAASGLLVTLGDSPALALTIPSKLQAYLAAGRPVIASLNGEGARIVREAKAGITCPAEDAEALASAVLQLYSLKPEERARLGENGHRYFCAHFEPMRRTRELIEHFRDVATQKRKRNR